MKYLKFILINIIVFSIFFFLLSLLFPNVINSNKTITVSANKEKVYNAILSLKDWKNWNEFSKLDDATVILQFNNNDTIATVLKLKNSQTLLSTHCFVSTDNFTVVNWLLQEKIKWYQPFKKFAALFTDKRINYTMEVSLDNFKKQMEVSKD